MIIKELYIKAFGRFTDKKILLGDGLNIVYGLNETGKSTIHKFIEAMFFGFVKPGVKRRVMTEDYKLYRPWSGDLYEGSLVYQLDNRLYKVQRNMAKGRESLKVFDHITGEDITKDFGYDKARREVLFARQHLGLSQTVFKNTISIGQLDSKSDAALAQDIQTRLGNLENAGTADISVGRAEKLIREYLDSIGTQRAYTKEYGQLCRQIDELEQGIKASAAAVEDVRSLGQQLKEAALKAEGLKNERTELENRIKGCRDRALLKRWADIKDLIEQLEDIETQLEEYKGYEDFVAINSEELFSLQRMIEEDRNEIAKLKAKGQETRMDMAELEQRPGGQNRRALRRSVRKNLVLCVLAALASVAAALTAAMLKNSLLYVSIVPFIGLLFYSVRRLSAQKKSLREAESLVRKLELDRRYMEKYLEELQQSLHEREGELRGREQRASAILTEAGVNTVEDYRDRAAGQKKYIQLCDRLRQIKELLNARLDGETIEEIEKKAEAVDATEIEVEVEVDATAEVAAGDDLSHWEARLEKIKQDQAALLGSMEKTRGSIETLQQGLNILPDMEEQLTKALDRRRQLEFERQAAQIALEGILKASAGVHREFAPQLNRKVGAIISDITDGRYCELRITNDLEIMATVPETARQVKAERLSGGTVDQFYFALRAACSELLAGDKKLPLILDDSFVQYDNQRLEKAMEYLLKVSACRQIILFTCQQREREVADRLGGVYNYLKTD